MPAPKNSRSRTIREIGRIVVRDALLPINAIILAIVLLLIIFGQTRESFSLLAVVVINTLMSVVEDVRAWLLLERVQLLSIPKVVRIQADGTEVSITLEEIEQGDRLRLNLGDQMPCDGIVEQSSSLEVNEGLITGESDSLVRDSGATILAGSIVTAGSAVVRVETSFGDSRMAKMARGLERYSANPSPIQRAIQQVIQYTIYVLLIVAVFVIARGLINHDTGAKIVEQIGALASTLVPQGLVVSTTLLFTFGAWHFYNRNVLLQEVNATEKFGRIKNLCMDKTGTLTENELTMESFVIAPHINELDANTLATLYVEHTTDVSQSIKALRTFFNKSEAGTVREILSFSSWRKYGGILITHANSKNPDTVVLVGSPEALAPFLQDDAQRTWLGQNTRAAAQTGKHVLCIVKTSAVQIPQQLETPTLELVGIFELSNKLREGVQDAINFFQSRNVTVRIISGDNPDTVQAIAKQAGVNNTDKLITGPQMEQWSAAEYEEQAQHYAIFARVAPEQKEHIIEALKKSGFTAMVGDGANDALSVKKADLGIAIFGGATATRQIAAVVLMHNSFAELPAGVRLAASMIENIEIFSSIFFNETLLQFALFAGFALIGLDFPLAPLNVTFMNYFTVGLVGFLISIWAVKPQESITETSDRPFLSRVLPVSFVLAIFQALTIIAIFGIAHMYTVTDSAATLIITAVMALSLVYLNIVSELYSGGLSWSRRLSVYTFTIFELAFFFGVFQIPFVPRFFGVVEPTHAADAIIAAATLISGIVQYIVVNYFLIHTKSKLSSTPTVL